MRLEILEKFIFHINFFQFNEKKDNFLIKLKSIVGKNDFI